MGLKNKICDIKIRNSVNLASSFNQEGKINEEIKNLKKALKALESLYKEPSKKWIQHHEIIFKVYIVLY